MRIAIVFLLCCFGVSSLAAQQQGGFPALTLTPGEKLADLDTKGRTSRIAFMNGLLITELQGFRSGHIGAKIWDISNPRAPQLVKMWEPNHADPSKAGPAFAGGGEHTYGMFGNILFLGQWENSIQIGEFGNPQSITRMLWSRTHGGNDGDFLRTV